MHLLKLRSAIAGVLAAAALCLPSVATADIVPPEVPSLPDPVPVMLDPATTAYAILDINSAVCAPRPACVATTVPVVQRLLTRARAANAVIIYSNSAGGTILPEVAPRPDDPIVIAHADKFFDTQLDQILQARGIKTVLMVGVAANGAVLYTAYEATLRGYTVAVPVDGISSGVDFDTFLTEYQLLNQPGASNPTNDPLKLNAVTLSRGDLVSISATPK